MANSSQPGRHYAQSSWHEPAPYVGPRPFTRDDRDIFFGRNQEALELTSLIKAHPEVLLYAQSGAGKTSLLYAQVMPILDHEEEFDVLPSARVRSQESLTIPDDKINNIYMFNALRDLSGDKLSLLERAQFTLAGYLKSQPRPMVKSPEHSAAHPTEENTSRLPRVIIFDQFEEIFTLYPERYKDRQGFFSQVADALEADQFLRVVFSMREDYIAELDPYIDLMPQKLRTRFRLERLRKTNALSAVKKPLETTRFKKTGRQFAAGAAESLVERLMLIKVKTSSGDKIEVPGEFVDPVQLQVVCQTLWEKLPPDDVMITEEDLDKYANVEEALSDFYENSIRKAVAAANAGETKKTSTGSISMITEGAVRGWFDQVLITREGKRNMILRERETTGGLSNRVVDELENQHLVRVEMRSGEPWYELSHDRFIPPIRESNRRWLFQQPLARRKAQELEERANEWLNAKRDRSLLLDRGELLDAQNWLRSPEAAAIGYSETLYALIQDSALAIEHEDNKQQRILAEEQRLRVIAEQQRARQLKIGFVVASLLLVLTLTSTGFAIVKYRQANAAQTSATKNYENAQQALADATAAREKERTAAGREREQRKIAEDAANNLGKANAQKEAERVKAEVARKRAEEAGAVAKREKAEADKQRDRAEANEKKAKENEDRAKANSDHARKEADNATSAKLAGDAQLQLSTDPELSLRLAISAFDGSKTAEAAFSLRKAYLEFKDRIILRGHTGVVRQAVYSPDGRFIFTASEDMTVKKWNANTNEEVKAFRGLGHGGGIYALTISSDGTRMATEASDETGRIWNTSDGKSLELKDLTGPVSAIAFSPDGRLLATEATSEENRPGAAPRIWDVETGAIRQTLRGHSQAVSALAFNLTGSLLVTASWDTTARIWEVSTGRQTAILKDKHTAPLASVAFSPNGALVVTGSYDGTARVWDAVTGEEKVALRGHTGVVHGVAFSPDGKSILTWGKKVRAVEQVSNTRIPLPDNLPTDDEALDDNSVRLWNVETGRQVLLINGHTGDVNSATFSSSGTLIATASEDGTARVWETSTGASKAVLRPASGKGQNGAVFSPDEKLLVTAGVDLTTQVWKIISSERQARFRAHRRTVLSAKFTPDNKSVITSGSDGERRWNAATGTPQPASVEFPPGNNAYSTTSPDGNFVVTASRPQNRRDFNAHVWDVRSKTFAYELAGHNGPVKLVSYSPKGNYVVTVSEVDGTARVWETSTWKLAGTFAPSPTDAAQRVLCAAFSNDERYLATGQDKGTVWVWDVRAGTRIHVIPAHEAAVNSVAFTSDDGLPLIVSASSDATVQVCNAIEDKCTQLRGHTGPVNYAEFSHDGTYVVSVGIDRTIRVWETETGNPIAELRGYPESLRSAAFNSNNTEIVAGGQNGTVFVSRCDVCRPIEAVKDLALGLKPRELTDLENVHFGLDVKKK